MESTNLNSRPDDDRQLETLLRDLQPPLPDARFTQHVMSGLPPRGVVPTYVPSRLALATCAAGLGLLVAFRLGLSLGHFTLLIERLDAALASSAIPERGSAALIAVVATIGSLYYALRSRSHSAM